MKTCNWFVRGVIIHVWGGLYLHFDQRVLPDCGLSSISASKNVNYVKQLVQLNQSSPITNSLCLLYWSFSCVYRLDVQVCPSVSEVELQCLVLFSQI